MTMPELAAGQRPVHRYPLRVQWEDTDAAGIVYYANYLRYIERGRSDLLLAHGIDQRGLMDGGESGESDGRGGAAFAVRACNVEYLKPARLHEDLVVTTAITALQAGRDRKSTRLNSSH